MGGNWNEDNRHFPRTKELVGAPEDRLLVNETMNNLKRELDVTLASIDSLLFTLRHGDLWSEFYCSTSAKPLFPPGTSHTPKTTDEYYSLVGQLPVFFLATNLFYGRRSRSTQPGGFFLRGIVWITAIYCNYLTTIV